jgi:hypothetical protein
MEKKNSTKKVTKKVSSEKKEKVTPGKKTSSSKKFPSHEEIMVKAQEIYIKRIKKGESGSAESDWLAAEKFLMGKKI